MHSMRQRSCDIVASAVTAFLVMALLTAATTILRDIVLRPHPIVQDVRVSGSSALYALRQPTLLSPKNSDASLYYIPNADGDGVVLPPNIDLLDLRERPEDSEEERKRKAWQRQRVPPGFDVGVRRTHRIILYLSGMIDFSPLWDWNTKAVYISFVARFHSASTTQNDVVFLDAVMRPASPPASVMRLVQLRRQERLEKKRTQGHGNAAESAPSSPSLLSDAEWQQLTAYEQTLRNREHDHPSLYIDHVDRLLFLNESYKYFVDAFDDSSLPGSVVEVVLRYQVMSYSGWAPVREEVLGHRVKVQMPPTAVPWESQRSA